MWNGIPKRSEPPKSSPPESGFSPFGDPFTRRLEEERREREAARSFADYKSRSSNGFSYSSQNRGEAANSASNAAKVAQILSAPKQSPTASDKQVLGGQSSAQQGSQKEVVQKLAAASKAPKASDKEILNQATPTHTGSPKEVLEKLAAASKAPKASDKEILNQATPTHTGSPKEVLERLTAASKAPKASDREMPHQPTPTHNDSPKEVLEWLAAASKAAKASDREMPHQARSTHTDSPKEVVQKLSDRRQEFKNLNSGERLDRGSHTSRSKQETALNLINTMKSRHIENLGKLSSSRQSIKKERITRILEENSRQTKEVTVSLKSDSARSLYQSITLLNRRGLFRRMNVSIDVEKIDYEALGAKVERNKRSNSQSSTEDSKECILSRLKKVQPQSSTLSSEIIKCANVAYATQEELNRAALRLHPNTSLSIGGIVDGYRRWKMGADPATRGGEITVKTLKSVPTCAGLVLSVSGLPVTVPVLATLGGFTAIAVTLQLKDEEYLQAVMTTGAFVIPPGEKIIQSIKDSDGVFTCLAKGFGFAYARSFRVISSTYSIGNSIHDISQKECPNPLDVVDAACTIYGETIGMG